MKEKETKEELSRLAARAEESLRMQREEEKVQQYAQRKEKLLELRKQKEDEVFQQKQAARNQMIESQARRLAQMQNDEDSRILNQVAQKEADDENKRIAKEEAKARWEADIQKSRANQIARKQAAREREKAEDAETSKFLQEWCKVLDKQEQEELELKSHANKKLAGEHKRMVEVARRRVEADGSQEQEVAMCAKRAIEADTIEFHGYAENCIRDYSSEGKNVIPLIKELREFRKRVLE